MKRTAAETQKMLNVWAIVLILWSGFRTYFGTDLPIWLDEFIIKPLIFLGPLYYYITTQEKTSFFAGIDLKLKNIKLDLLLGFGIGILFFVSGAFAFFYRGQTISIGGSALQVAMTIGMYVLISLASSFSEEALSRGFVLKRLYEESRNPISAVFFSSFLFFFLHIPILFTSNLYGVALMKVMITDLLLSFAVSFAYLERKSLLVPILIHAFYNLSIYLFM